MKKILCAALCIPLFFSIAYQVMAYTPTAEQILENTVKLNRNLDSLHLHFKITLFDDRYGEGTIEIPGHSYLKAEILFRSERKFPHGDDMVIQNGRKSVASGINEASIGGRSIDTVFPFVFLRRSTDRLIDDLNFLGVDTSAVALDRIKKTVTFVIGNRDEKIPGSSIWLEKSRGFPLRFVGVGTLGGKRVTLRADYMDYTQIQKRFWIPTRIEYYQNDTLRIVCTVENVILNEKMPQSLFAIPQGTYPFVPLTNFLNVKE